MSTFHGRERQDEKFKSLNAPNYKALRMNAMKVDKVRVRGKEVDDIDEFVYLKNAREHSAAKPARRMGREKGILSPFSP